MGNDFRRVICGALRVGAAAAVVFIIGAAGAIERGASSLPDAVARIAAAVVAAAILSALSDAIDD